MIEAVDAHACELLATLHAQAFDKAWSAAEIAKMLENQAVFALLAQDDEPQGFVMVWAAAGDGEILTLAVAPSARRRGIGVALVEAASAAALLRGADSMHLEVAENNEAARALYAKLGYAEAGRRRDYYATADGWIDAIVMRRDLPRPTL